ncbi:hypothetical protein P7C70_g2585, partial [Phenoliferia sp. Uapishka_3]
MPELHLFPFLDASNAPALALGIHFDPGSSDLKPLFTPTWSNKAWKKRFRPAGSVTVESNMVTKFELEPEDEATLSAILTERLAATGGDKELQIQLKAGAVRLTLLREAGIVIITLSPPSPPCHCHKTNLCLPPWTPPLERPFPSFVLEAEGSFLDEFVETEMGRRIAAFPWETTAARASRSVNKLDTPAAPLGPIKHWSAAYKVTVAAMLSSPDRTFISLGLPGTFLYNDAYIATAQGKHPRCLGIPPSQVWTEVWSLVGVSLNNAMDGQTILFKNQELPLARNGALEESFHTYSFTYVREKLPSHHMAALTKQTFNLDSPIWDENSEVVGVSCLSFETTPEVLTERRMATVQQLVHSTSGARTVNEFCDTALACLSENPYDFPFALLYTTEAADVKISRRKGWAVPVESNGSRAAVKLTLRGAVGLPESHLFHIPVGYADLSCNGLSGGSQSTGRTPTVEFSWPFDQAVRQTEPILLDGSDIAAIAATLPARAWSETPTQVVIKPIWTDGKEFPAAILIFGVNSRGTYKDSYKGFTQVIARHVGIGLLQVTNSEADAARAFGLQQLDKAKTSFFSSTSHELRTPLTLITGPLEDILAGKDIKRDVREKLELVSRNANRLLSMVNKLLEFSALEGGRTKNTFHPVDLGPFTTQLASLFRDTIERSGLDFDVQCDDDPENALPTYISRDLYRSIIFNLLGNALKYCPSGTISVRLRSTQAECALEVTDTGVGIPADELSKIFERFHRVESTHYSAPGTGIGLALTLEVVKTLGAQLEVTSEVGLGSTFFVKFRRGFTHLPSEQITHHQLSDDGELAARLSESEIKEAASYQIERKGSYVPLMSGDLSETASGRGTTTESISGGSSVDFFDIRNSTILLAEDSPDLRAYISGLLGKHYNVVAVPDGQAALEYALQNPPSLVLTDVMMPRLGGEGLLEALRSNARTALIPVIFLSAAAGAESRAQALERGVDDYLVKPFQSRELLARVRVHLTLGSMRQELELRVTERTAELNESEVRYRGLAQRYSAINELAPVGIFQMSSAAEVLCHPMERPLSEWMLAVHPEFLSALQNLEADIHGGRVSASLQILYQNGYWAQLELRKVDAFGPSVAYLGTITDITAQKKIEALHLETVEAKAADADTHRRQIEAFIDITSHELRNRTRSLSRARRDQTAYHNSTPPALSGVHQNACCVKSSLEETALLVAQMQTGNMPSSQVIDKLAEEMKENVEGLSAILLCAAHQGRIADDILNVSKLNMGLLTINKTSFDLTSKLREVVTMFEAECCAKAIGLSLVIHESMNELNVTHVIADPNRVAQVAVNLLLNSAKFTPPNGRITLSASASLHPPPERAGTLRVGQTELEDTSLWIAPLYITVDVVDTGKGLTAEEMQVLFQRFAQINPRTDQYGGAGLGLYLSKSLVALHNGFIEVASQPGFGSSFSFTIPVERGSGAQIPPLLKRPAFTESRTSPDTEDSKRKQRKVPLPSPALHVLVVEDNEINQKVLKRQLMKHHYTVTVANNGQEALDILQVVSKPFDVVLMDLEMPVMGGLEAIKKLRAREVSEACATPYGIIAVTGNARQEQIATYLAAGFTDVAIKPYSFPALLEQIEWITGRCATALNLDD